MRCREDTPEQLEEFLVHDVEVRVNACVPEFEARLDEVPPR